MMYIVTAIRETNDTNNVEIAGVFDTPEKALEAKEKVTEWMEQNEYDNYEVFIQYTKVNHIAWYEIEEDV